jgi:hypothetical protein
MDMKMSQEHQAQFNRYFPKRAIAYQSGWALVFESVTVGVLFSQLLYWHGKGKRQDGWIYKSADELRQETGLSYKQQTLAIKKLKSLGIIEVKLMGTPATRHFMIDLEKVRLVLPSLKEKAHLTYPNPPMKLGHSGVSITKSTQGTTTIITKDNFTKFRNTRRSNYKVEALGQLIAKQPKPVSVTTSNGSNITQSTKGYESAKQVIENIKSRQADEPP